MNWWWTPNVRLMLNYVSFKFSEDIIIGADPANAHSDLSMVYLRWQIDF